MRRSTCQCKNRVFSEKGGDNSVNEGFRKDFCRKGNSVKRSGPFSEPLDSTEKLLSSSPSRKSAPTKVPPFFSQLGGCFGFLFVRGGGRGSLRRLGRGIGFFFFD